MATTVNSSLINATYPFIGKSFQSKANKVQNARSSSPNRTINVYPFDTGNISVPSTSSNDATDEFFAITFPGNCRLLMLRYTSADRDTNATPTLVEDVIVENSAGTEVVLINDTTVGQGGGEDELDANLSFLDVSSMKLGIKIDTGAATAATANIRFRGLVILGEDGEAVIKF